MLERRRSNHRRAPVWRLTVSSNLEATSTRPCRASYDLPQPTGPIVASLRLNHPRPPPPRRSGGTFKTSAGTESAGAGSVI
jgi:hypothetical protein